jgi:hypothetical protein
VGAIWPSATAYARYTWSRSSALESYGEASAHAEIMRRKAAKASPHNR